MDLKKLVTEVDLYRGEKNEGKGANLLKGKIIGVYFSAGWCGPCRQFTPKLKRFYEKLIKEGKPFEIIFVSADHEKEEALEYYEEKMGKWLMLEFNEKSFEDLKNALKIPGIPEFKIIKSDGTIIVDDGRSEVTEQGSDDPVALFTKWEKLAA
uniref:Thioredoxin domain-containing protein n=1 Tax=Parastrongyloides trichosuri TaxID=131310 RepID=A0A0N4ZEM3_PARTI